MALGVICIHSSTRVYELGSDGSCFQSSTEYYVVCKQQASKTSRELMNPSITEGPHSVKTLEDKTRYFCSLEQIVPLNPSRLSNIE